MAKDPDVGLNNSFYVPFPVLALASNGEDIFMTAGGGGSTSVKEVPNSIHAHRYCEVTNKLSTIAALNTAANLVVNLSYSPAANLWLASTRQGCKIVALNGNSLVELCHFDSESEGKGPEQNFAVYSPDARYIVTGGTDGLVKVWNASERGAVPILHSVCGSKTKEILDAAFSPDSRYMAACDGSGDCRLWDLQRNLQDDGLRLTYNSKAVKGKALIKLVRFVIRRKGIWGAKDDSITLALGGNGTQRKMNWAVLGLFSLSGELVKEVVVDQGPMKSMSCSPDEQFIVVGLMAGKKVIIKYPEMKCKQKTKELHSLPAQCVAWTGESTAISVSGDRDIHLLRVGPRRDSGGDGSGGDFYFLLILFLLLMLVFYQVFRIGTIGASVGQGAI